MKRYLYQSLLLVISGLCIGLYSCTTTAPVVAEEGSEMRASLDSLFNYLYAQQMFNGAVAVVHEGELIFSSAYGLANVETEENWTLRTSMEVASVSKQFTASAIMLLQQNGKLSVSDDVKAYLPNGFPYEGLTIEHLLSHTGGLPDYTNYFKEHWPADQFATNADIVAYFIQEKPAAKFAPGTDYDYSNTGYVLLAEIVEAASGMSLDQYLESVLFRPFHLKSAGFYLRSEIYSMKDYAPSFMWSSDSCEYIRPENLPDKSYYYFLSGRFGPGRLSMSVEDLLKWDRLLYSDKFLSASTKEAMFSPVEFEGVETDYGYGWHNYEDEKVGSVSYHTGSWAGNLSYIKRFRDIKSTVVLLNNTYSPYMKEIREAVDDIVTGRRPAVIKPYLQQEFTHLFCSPDFDANAWLEGLDLEKYTYKSEELEAIRSAIKK